LWNKENEAKRNGNSDNLKEQKDKVIIKSLKMPKKRIKYPKNLKKNKDPKSEKKEKVLKKFKKCQPKLTPPLPSCHRKHPKNEQ
jgi:hypothetical protein